MINIIACIYHHHLKWIDKFLKVMVAKGSACGKKLKSFCTACKIWNSNMWWEICKLPWKREPWIYVMIFMLRWIEKTQKSLNVCVCVDAILFSLSLSLLLFLSNRWGFFHCCCWLCCCCWYFLEPKVIFDYKSLHRVMGEKKRKHYSNNGSLVYILFAEVKPNQTKYV